MASATQFFQYWALAFVTLGIALLLLSLFYRIIDSDLQLHSFRREVVIAIIGSAIQGASFWFLVSFFPGQEPSRALFVPCAIVGFIYFLSHVGEWSGHEFFGIALFQVVILVAGLSIFRGDFKLALILLGVFAFGLTIIAGIAKNL